MEAAIGERAAQAFVEEQEEERLPVGLQYRVGRHSGGQVRSSRP